MPAADSAIHRLNNRGQVSQFTLIVANRRDNVFLTNAWNPVRAFPKANKTSSY